MVAFFTKFSSHCLLMTALFPCFFKPSGDDFQPLLVPGFFTILCPLKAEHTLVNSYFIQLSSVTLPLLRVYGCFLSGCLKQITQLADKVPDGDK